MGTAKPMYAGTRDLGGIFAVRKPRGHHGGNGPQVGAVLLLLRRAYSRSFVLLCRWKRFPNRERSPRDIALGRSASIEATRMRQGVMLMESAVGPQLQDLMPVTRPASRQPAAASGSQRQPIALAGDFAASLFTAVVKIQRLCDYQTYATLHQQHLTCPHISRSSASLLLFLPVLTT
jgi:hypothetical protein